MKNERGAGRKPVINNDELNIIKYRLNAGEGVAKIAKEYGISRQALYSRVKKSEDKTVTLEYVVDGEVTTIIEADFNTERIRIENMGNRISKYAFGLNQNPEWEDFTNILMNQLIRTDNQSEGNCKRFLFRDSRDNEFSLYEVISKDVDDTTSNKSKGLRIVSKGASDGNESSFENKDVPKFVFKKKDILYSRTDTDGYQLKALSKDRKYFVKSQAIIGGIYMNDWAVEIMASDICEQLNIPCVKQRECEFVYGDRIYKGVYSDNFELDGYTFISFERLLERIGESSMDSEFISYGAVDKMKWCAERLAKAGDLSYEDTFKYMLDLAIVDCIVGNIDRHTKNFGLFFNSLTGRYETPLIFDNGMGLFENDGYRDSYSSYDAAMMNVYVAPYGEDPFDMMQLLMEEYDLLKLYPGLKDLTYHTCVDTPFAKIYMERMKELWQK